MNFDVVIIGAGAAGLMAAVTAGRRGRAVLVLDHADTIGKKIRIAGGGRCNFTNLNVRAEHYISGAPRFPKSALAQFPPSAFLALIEKYRIPFEERKDGQLFCLRSSADIIRMLEQECREARVAMRLGADTERVEKSGAFTLTTSRGVFSASSLIIATGGLSYPQIGATSFGHSLARTFGLKVTELRPALVPLVFCSEDRERFGDLAGVSFDAEVRCNKTAFRGNVLFTHKGLSGPAVLQASSYWRQGDALGIDPLPGVNIFEMLSVRRREKTALHTLLSASLPRRFVQRWCELYAPSRSMNSYSTKELNRIAERLRRWEVRPSGAEGYGTAEVTRGGVDTAELSSKSMEARDVPGLYFAGEVLDVTGQLGGYNLQWAWSSGYAAGSAA